MSKFKSRHVLRCLLVLCTGAAATTMAFAQAAKPLAVAPTAKPLAVTPTAKAPAVAPAAKPLPVVQAVQPLAVAQAAQPLAAAGKPGSVKRVVLTAPPVVPPPVKLVPSTTCGRGGRAPVTPC